MASNFATLMVPLLYLLFLGKVSAILTQQFSSWGLDFTYHNYSSMDRFLRQTAEFYPDLATLYSIGRSVSGKELWVLKLSSPLASPTGTPHVKLIGNIHGNEPAGKEILLHFIQYLVSGYQDDEQAQLLLNMTHIHILPSMNPDGFELSKEGDCSVGPGRDNGNNIDLNRSFPDQFRKNYRPKQPETDAIIEWFKKYQFILSASFHGGALVVNYPLDNTPDGVPSLQDFMEAMEANGTRGVLFLELLRNFTDTVGMHETLEAARSPDDDVFKHLATTYANNHLTMHKGGPCNNTRPFPGGITNGAAWYALTGGMQDFNYLQLGCMELTLEISCCKYPMARNLPRLWKENKKALVELVKEANTGVRGLVLDGTNARPVSDVKLVIKDRGVTFFTSQKGEFWRILLPGSYLLQVEAPGYKLHVVSFIVRRLPSETPTSTWLTIFLQPNSAGNEGSTGKGNFLLVIALVLKFCTL